MTVAPSTSRMGFRRGADSRAGQCRSRTGRSRHRTREATTGTTSTTTNRSAKTLIQRLVRAGFSKEFVRTAVLPDWWEDACADDPKLVQDLEIRVARFLGQTISAVADANAPLVSSLYPNAQLRRIREINRDRLAPAIHAALRVAAAVVRSLRDTVPPPAVPPLPGDPLAWRDLIRRSSAAPRLSDLATDLWKRGVPVVPLGILPTPGFQGMACIVADRPVIMLGYGHDEPGRVAFVIAHEAGHIAAGDCAPDRPVVDEEDEISDDAEVEVSADRYATAVLVGSLSIPAVDDVASRDFKNLARQALGLEKETGADASSVIYSWARRTGDYVAATMAVKALYRNAGAQKELQRLLAEHVDFESAAETDRSLLLCVRRESALDEAAG